MKNNLLPIAKEGWIYIGYGILSILITSLFGFEILEFFSFIITGFFIYIFRNPERQNVIYEKNSVVSPVDGTIISIDEIKQDSNYSYKILIDSSYLDVSLLRVPLSSSLVSIDIKHGARLSDFSPLSKKINENTELIFKDNENVLKVQHMLKKSIVPINVDLLIEKKLLQGSRYGVMVNGITALYLPQNFRINVNVGDEVKASQALIGYFS